MYPVMLRVETLETGLVGGGAGALARARALKEAGAARLTIFAPSPSPALVEEFGAHLVTRLPDENDVAALRLMFVVDDGAESLAVLMKLARKHHVLFHAEDRNDECDFFATGHVRRGNLVVAVSTEGACPALTRVLRRYLEEMFPAAWADHVRLFAQRRAEWRKEGVAGAEITSRLRATIDRDQLIAAPR